MERRQSAVGGDFEDRADGVGDPTSGGCPVEVPIGGLDQARHGGETVRARALGAEAV